MKPLLVFVATLLMGACCKKLSIDLAPKVHQFRVAPEAYCPGRTKLHVTWNSGGGTAQFGEAGALAHVAESGSTDVPAKDTTYMLNVISGARHDAASVKVQPITELRPQIKQRVDTCDAGAPAYMRMGIVKTYRADEIDPSASVRSITNPCTSSDPNQPCPTLVVQHVLPEVPETTSHPTFRTNAWRLAPGQEIRLQAGEVGMAGTWILLREEVGNEQCPYHIAAAPAGPPTAPPPAPLPVSLKNLEIDLELECAEVVTP